jgi:hypothetical protein
MNAVVARFAQRVQSIPPNVFHICFFPCAKLSFLSSLHSVLRTSVLVAVSVKYYLSVLALSLVVPG